MGTKHKPHKSLTVVSSHTHTHSHRRAHIKTSSWPHSLRIKLNFFVVVIAKVPLLWVSLWVLFLFLYVCFCLCFSCCFGFSNSNFVFVSIRLEALLNDLLLLLFLSEEFATSVCTDLFFVLLFVFYFVCTTILRYTSVCCLLLFIIRLPRASLHDHWYTYMYVCVYSVT